MADQLTPVLGLIKPNVGGDTDQWGEMLNTNSDTIDAAMGAVETELAGLTNGVSNATFPAGTRLLFQQSTAPTGWTKDATVDDRALRIVGGNVSAGGAIGFSQCFASRNVGGQTDTVAVGGTVHDMVLDLSQIPAHRHETVNSRGSSGDNASNNAGFGTAGRNANMASVSNFASTPVGLTSFSGSGAAHGHGFTGSSHAHSWGGVVDMTVAYVDAIIAVKN